jgi:lycopene cyclase-like protein
MYDIIILGSGPSALLALNYFNENYNLNIAIISKSFNPSHCTYGLFDSQIKYKKCIQNLDLNKLFPKSFLAYYNFNENEYPKPKFKKNLFSLSEEYIILDNKYLNNSILNNSNQTHILGEAIEINDIKNHKQVLYYDKANTLHTIEGKIVLEGLGHYNPIGVKYLNNFNKYKQVFVGYEIELNHKLSNINKAIIMDWYKLILVSRYDNNIPSFSYIFPINDNKLFIEETILVIEEEKFSSDTYKLLELRLLERLYRYGIKDYNILKMERNCINMNRYIPDFNTSKSIGIGISGNMMNIVSGYSLGYNINNIPEICDLIVENNFDTKKVYQKYWNIHRRFIFYINYGGLMFLNSLYGKGHAGYVDFFRHYFNVIVKNNYRIHRILFFNSNEYLNWNDVKLFFQLPNNILYNLIYYTTKSFLGF